MPIINVGGIVKGRVTGVEKYGVFILTEDGYTGLIHISEVSDKFVKSISDYVEVDDIIYSKVLSVDEKEKKLKLSIKNFNYHTGEEDTISDINGFGPLRENLPKWIAEYESRK